MAGRPLSRRGLLGTGLGLAALVTVGATGTRSSSARYAQDGLHSQTVAWSAPGERQLIGAADQVVPGTRVMRGAAGQATLIARESAWIAGCAPWTATTRAREALLDLTVLQVGDVGVAGWSTHWRYTWPRDASHVAMALIRAGRRAEAVRMLARLQAWQGRDGWFEARYLPDGSGTPDERERQLDGVGWVLWATAGLLQGPDALTQVRLLRPMIERSLGLAMAVTADGLPPVSPDYWEVGETRRTLGTAAPLLAGLQAGARLLAALGEPAGARRARRAAVDLEARIHEVFGARGYPRHEDGTLRDTGVAFLLPPYTEAAHPDVVAAVRAARSEMVRPAGGLAPGAGWREDGVSWTPETAVFALVAAAQGADAATERAYALDTLAWLGRHRTEAGSYPEKVLYDGRPAAVAPLAWTAATVLLAEHALATTPT
ncbi:hypothetical protein [Serinibacter salmoneus]|uniref:Glycoside hydrolase family 15 n=1 Tax=Serinibacter salmoneus TaxID=556530 RepID=A0A2A9D3M4_9MICO|nr:hypothetical protein [Serinibacter salmoneus]PFG21318.1 hypothetical protein ATL40_2945 [Serinibacter salmoneus]